MIKKLKNGSIRATGNDANSIIRALRGDDKMELFNKNYKVGDRVKVKNDLDEEFIDEILYPASILGGHTAVA